MNQITHREVCQKYGLKCASILLYFQEELNNNKKPTRLEIANALNISVSTYQREKNKAKDIFINLQNKNMAIILNNSLLESVKNEPFNIKECQKRPTKSVKNEPLAKENSVKNDSLNSVKNEPQKKHKNGYKALNNDVLEKNLSKAHDLPDHVQDLKIDHVQKDLRSKDLNIDLEDHVNLISSKLESKHVNLNNNIRAKKEFSSLVVNKTSLKDNKAMLDKTSIRKKKKRNYPSNEELLNLASAFDNSNQFLELWEDFINHRKTHKHGPLSLIAAKRMLKKLQGFKDAGYCYIEALNTSIAKNYSDVYRPYKSIAEQQETPRVNKNNNLFSNKDALLEILNRSKIIEKWLEERGFGILQILDKVECPYRDRNGFKIKYIDNFYYNLYKRPITLFYTENVDVSQFQVKQAITYDEIIGEIE